MGNNEKTRLWDRLSPFYGAFIRRHSAGTYDAAADRIRARIRPEMSVLELACGTGQMTYLLCGSAAIWEATDISPVMIARAERIPHSEHVRFSVQDAESLPYEHASFDAVVVSNALDVFEHPSIALREIRRVLVPGGLFFSATHVLGGRRTDDRDRLVRLAKYRPHHTWTAPQLEELIRSHGFTVETAVLLPNELAPLCYLEAKR